MLPQWSSIPFLWIQHSCSMFAWDVFQISTELVFEDASNWIDEDELKHIKGVSDRSSSKRHGENLINKWISKNAFPWKSLIKFRCQCGRNEALASLNAFVLKQKQLCWCCLYFRTQEKRKNHFSANKNCCFIKKILRSVFVFYAFFNHYQNNFLYSSFATRDVWTLSFSWQTITIRFELLNSIEWKLILRLKGPSNEFFHWATVFNRKIEDMYSKASDKLTTNFRKA